MERKASATWRGGLKDGNGVLTSASGVLSNTKYSFHTRFENEPGTNPEELIAAAHAGCFAMALSAQLTNAGFAPERIDTSAVVKLEKVGDGFGITKSQLTLRAVVPGIEESKFMELANNAKAGCPVSKVLKAEITLDAKLETKSQAA